MVPWCLGGQMTMDKAKSRTEIASLAAQLRDEGKRVVFTNGCFDVLHVGHVRCLQAARSHGDVLVVGLNSDASVKRLKGDSRPLNSQDARAEMLAVLDCVDHVVVFDEDTPIELLKAIRPHVHVKGGDYEAEALPETPVVKSWGGEVVIVPTVEGYSTSSLLQSHPSSLIPHPSASIVVALIPARFGSSRLPGKALADINGKPMIQHVYERAQEATLVDHVIIATDDRRIVEAVRAFGGEVVMTSPHCRTGTDRIAEAVRLLECDLVVNVQGDEPMIDPAAIDAAIEPLKNDARIVMGTIGCPMGDEEEWTNANAVKVVVDREGFALYFSRSSIPRVRDATVAPPTWLKHIGLYVYRKAFLLKYAALPTGALEQVERLEQLRALEHGYRIRVVVRDYTSVGVDTPDDLERVRALMRD